MIRRNRALPLLLTALVVVAGCSVARHRCEEQTAYLYRPEARLLTVSEAESVKANALVKDILASLPYHVRDNCFGLYCPEWDVEDGRVLVVSYGALCERPVAVSLR